MIENPFKDNLRAVIQFLVAEGRQRMEIYKSIKIVYDDYSYFHTTMVV